MTTTDEVQQQPGSNRHTGALLTAMGLKEPPASQEVVGLMGRREQIMRMDSAATQVFCTHCDVEDQGEQVEAEAQLSGLHRLLAQGQNMQMAISLTMQRLFAWWSILQKVLQSMQRKRVPVLLQLSAVECGAACLAMILSYYGRKTSVSEVRDRVGVGRDGLRALDIVKAARGYGLRVPVYRV